MYIEIVSQDRVHVPVLFQGPPGIQGPQGVPGPSYSYRGDFTMVGQITVPKTTHQITRVIGANIFSVTGEKMNADVTVYDNTQTVVISFVEQTSGHYIIY